MTEMVTCECNECECTRWMETQDDECDDCFVGDHSVIKRPQDDEVSA